jgi:hypothetical protein
MEINEQFMKAMEQRRHKENFAVVISAHSGITVNVADIEWATSLSRDELFIVALIASARYRESLPKTEETKL